MNLKAILFVLAAAVLVATFFIDSRLTPVVGASMLLAAIIYSWAQNRNAGKASYRTAERATRRQRDQRAHEPR